MRDVKYQENSSHVSRDTKNGTFSFKDNVRNYRSLATKFTVFEARALKRIGITFQKNPSYISWDVAEKVLCNLCEWTRNLCIKLVVIKKLDYDARPTKYQQISNTLLSNESALN